MDFQKLTEYRNQQNRFAQRIGMALEEIRPGYARVVKTVDADDANPLGVPHGGVYFSMSDNACGSAMASYGYMAVTLNASYQFFRAPVLETISPPKPGSQAWENRLRL